MPLVHMMSQNRGYGVSQTPLDYCQVSNYQYHTFLASFRMILRGCHLMAPPCQSHHFCIPAKIGLRFWSPKIVKGLYFNIDIILWHILDQMPFSSMLSIRCPRKEFLLLPLIVAVNWLVFWDTWYIDGILSRICQRMISILKYSP